MALSDDLVIETLRGIRSDLADLRAEVQSGLADLRAEVQATNVQLDETRSEVGGHIVALGKTMEELAVQQRFVVRYTRPLAERGSTSADELASLRGRVERIEQKIGLEP